MVLVALFASVDIALYLAAYFDGSPFVPFPHTA
jgi:hypothetical protein